MMDGNQAIIEKLLQNGQKALDEGRLSDAVRAFRGILDQRDDDRAHLALGTALAEMDDLEGARKAYYEAIRANPVNLRAYLVLAKLLGGQEQLHDAFEVYAQASQVAENLKASKGARASILFYMGEVKLALNELKEALGLFDQAVDLAPDTPDIPASAGDALAEEGHLKESESYYLKALEMDPSLAHVYNRLGVAYRRQGKYQMALDLYNKATNFSPEDENLRFNMGRCLWEMGNRDQAILTLHSAIRINPDFLEAKALLNMLKQKKNEDAGG